MCVQKRVQTMRSRESVRPEYQPLDAASYCYRYSAIDQLADVAALIVSNTN